MNYVDKLRDQFKDPIVLGFIKESNDGKYIIACIGNSLHTFTNDDSGYNSAINRLNEEVKRQEELDKLSFDELCKRKYDGRYSLGTFIDKLAKLVGGEVISLRDSDPTLFVDGHLFSIRPDNEPNLFALSADKLMGWSYAENTDGGLNKAKEYIDQSLEFLNSRLCKYQDRILELFR